MNEVVREINDLSLLGTCQNRMQGSKRLDLTRKAVSETIVTQPEVSFSYLI